MHQKSYIIRTNGRRHRPICLSVRILHPAPRSRMASHTAAACAWPRGVISEATQVAISIATSVFFSCLQSRTLPSPEVAPAHKKPSSLCPLPIRCYIDTKDSRSQDREVNFESLAIYIICTVESRLQSFYFALSHSRSRIARQGVSV